MYSRNRWGRRRSLVPRFTLFCVNTPNEGESLKQQYKEPYKSVESHLKLECNSLLKYFHCGKFSHPARSNHYSGPQVSIFARKPGLKSSLALLLIWVVTSSNDAKAAKNLILMASSRELHRQRITRKGTKNTTSETWSLTFQGVLPLHSIYNLGKKT